MDAILAGGPLEFLCVAAVFVLAGLVKGVTGMGLPTVSVSLLALWMAPPAAAALLVMPSLMTNLAQCRGPALRRLASRLWPMWATLAIGLVAAPDLSKVSPIDTRTALGAVLVIYGLVGLRRPELPRVPEGERWLGALVGAATGVVTASTAVFVLPMVPYLQAMRLERDETVQALGLSFMVATVALAVRIGRDDAHDVLTGMSVVALLAALAGLAVGAGVRSRIGAATFQRALFAMFVLLGGVNLWRGA